MNYYLFSPIGATDPIRNNRDGALIHICRKYKPKKIVMYMSREILENHKKDNRYCLAIEALKKESGFEDWIPSVEIIERPDLVEVQKMDNFIDEFKSGIEKMKSECEKGDIILLNVSSGTPAMKYTLQLLSTQDEKLFLPVQVDTPKKACNAGSDPNMKNYKNYDPEWEWNHNEDNDPKKFEDRCHVSKNNNLFVYLLKEKITELIKNYDYAGALTIAKSIESELNAEFIELLESAKQRLAQNYVYANKVFKKYNFKMLLNETGDVARLYEYILYLHIKIKTDNYIEFTRGITPIFEDLLFYKVKKEVTPYIITKSDETPKWDVQKLLSGKFSNLNFMKNIDRGKNTAYIQSYQLIEIIKKRYPNCLERGTIDKIRKFESDTRNNIAHGIKSLNDDDKKNCEKVFGQITDLAVHVKLLNKDNVKNFLNSYDKMNDFLLEKL